MSATVVVTYGNALDAAAATRRTALQYEVGVAFMPLDPPAHAAAHREVTNQGPEPILVGPHPVAARAYYLAPGERVSFQRQGVLFAAVAP